MVEGTNLDGSSYSGTAEITLASETTCVIEWDTAGVKSTGVWMLNGNALPQRMFCHSVMSSTKSTAMARWTVPGRSQVKMEAVPKR